MSKITTTTPTSTNPFYVGGGGGSGDVYTYINRFYIPNSDGSGGMWVNNTILQQIYRQLTHEEVLRAKHPGLQELWNQYQMMLKLVDDNL